MHIAAGEVIRLTQAEVESAAMFGRYLNDVPARAG
jgi:hypothetical protein